jgi:hypothetical protein
MHRLYRHKRPALAILVAGIALGAAIAWPSFNTRPPSRQPLPLAGSLAASDVAIARALRNTTPATIGSMVSGSSRTAVERFYMARGFAPLWVERGVLNARGKAALSYLQSVGRVGLDPADYIDPAAQFAGGSESIARSELQFTVLVLKYVRDAMHGRIGGRLPRSAGVHCTAGFKFQIAGCRSCADRVCRAGLRHRAEHDHNGHKHRA